MFDYKSYIINTSLKLFEENILYRWSDVLDYICDNWDLDNEWDEIIDNICLKEFNLLFNNFADLQLTKNDIKTDPNTTKLCILIMEYLLNRFDESLKRKL